MKYYCSAHKECPFFNHWDSSRRKLTPIERTMDRHSDYVFSCAALTHCKSSKQAKDDFKKGHGQFSDFADETEMPRSCDILEMMNSLAAIKRGGVK